MCEFSTSEVVAEMLQHIHAIPFMKRIQYHQNLIHEHMINGNKTNDFDTQVQYMRVIKCHAMSIKDLIERLQSQISLTCTKSHEYLNWYLGVINKMIETCEIDEENVSSAKHE